VRDTLVICSPIGSPTGFCLCLFVCLFVSKVDFHFKGYEINECHLVVEGIRDQFCAQFHPEKFKQQNLNG